MIIQTTRFGEIEIQGEKIITFPEGIPGFWEIKDYVLLDHSPDSPIRWLQAVQEPDLAFVVMDPLLFKPDYQISIHPEDIAILGTQDVKILLVLAIITIPPGQPDQMTANLMGPLVINPEKRLAKQLVLQDPAYQTRYRVIEKAEPSTDGDSKPAAALAGANLPTA